MTTHVFEGAARLWDKVKFTGMTQLNNARATQWEAQCVNAVILLDLVGLVDTAMKLFRKSDYEKGCRLLANFDIARHQH